MDTIDNNDYTWTTRTNGDGLLEVFLDGKHVTTIQVMRDHRHDGTSPSELHLWATPHMSRGDGKIWVRTYGHGRH